MLSDWPYSYDKIVALTLAEPERHRCDEIENISIVLVRFVAIIRSRSRYLVWWVVHWQPPRQLKLVLK